MNKWLKIIIKEIVSARTINEQVKPYVVKSERTYFNRSDGDMDALLLLLGAPKLEAVVLVELLAIKASNTNFVLQVCVNALYETNSLLRKVIVNHLEAPHSEYLNAWHDWLLNATLELEGKPINSLTIRAIDILKLTGTEMASKLVAKVESLKLKGEINKSESSVTNKKVSAL